MRFKLDENLPRAAVSLLRAAGHDAMSVLEQGLGGESDRVLADICRSEDRVLLTFDTDFANIRAYPPDQHSGLIVLRLESQEKQHLLKVLRLLLPAFESDSPVGLLWIVEEDRIRIRES